MDVFLRAFSCDFVVYLFFLNKIAAYLQFRLTRLWPGIPRSRSSPVLL